MERGERAVGEQANRARDGYFLVLGNVVRLHQADRGAVGSSPHDVGGRGLAGSAVAGPPERPGGVKLKRADVQEVA